MRYKKQKSVKCISAGKRAAKRRRPALLAFCLTMCVALLAVLSLSLFSMPVSADPTVPSDYGDGYDESILQNLAVGDEYQGIRRTGANSYLLTFEGEYNGLVTLARFSRNSSLKNYVFEINHIKPINLGAQSGVSDGSFFGIGCDTYPFKGTIRISGASDTPVSIDKDGWCYFFNNLSNEASIVSDGSYRLYSSPSTKNGDTYPLCQKLTVTEDGTALDISGFRFGAPSTADNKGALVSGSGNKGLLACKVVKSDSASAFSVDLSSSLTDGIYKVESSDDDAAGIFGLVEAGAQVTVGLPDTFRCEAKAGGYQKNAAILVGTNRGTVTFTKGANAAADSPAVFSGGKVDATGSVGLIGACQTGGNIAFTMDVQVDHLTATGLRAGGLAGTCNGSLSIQNAQVTDSEFNRISTDESGRMGGAVGSSDYAGVGLTIAEGKTLTVSDNTFNATATCMIGGFIGSLNSAEADWHQVKVGNLTVNSAGSIGDKVGGWIGSLSIPGDLDPAVVSFRLGSDAPGYTFRTAAGNCGGVIGEVTADKKHTVLISGSSTTDTAYTITAANPGSTNLGGVVGRNTGYVKLDNLSLQNTITKAVNAGDLAGIIAKDAVLDIGNVSVKETNSSVLVANAEQGSVVRLSGTVTDLSAKVANLVFYQDGALIYKDVGCTYSGNSASDNDIGNYGQIVRNDELQIIVFNDTTHEVSFASMLDGSGDTVALTGRGDFAKLAITNHTRGAVSGVTGIDKTNYASLLEKNINLTANVSLENTGIEQLTPANSIAAPYQGTFYGNGNTVKLDIGRNIKGETPGVKDGTNNKRCSLALFSSVQNATVDRLNVNGTIHTSPICKDYADRNYDVDRYYGAIAGKASGTLTLSGCNTAANITLDANTDGTKKKGLYVGGAVGCMDSVSALSVTGCTVGGTIQDSFVYVTDNNYWGGLSGYVKYTGTGEINFQNNTISTAIQKAGTPNTLKMGGFIGVLDCQNYVTANLRGTKADGVDLKATGVRQSTGGMLGYEYRKCHVLLNRPFSGSVQAGAADLGGLLYNLDGRMTVESGFSISDATLTATGDNRGLLLSNGKTALVTIQADPSGFDNANTDNGFDLFVGENIETYTTVDVAASGGLVTVETDDGLGILPGDSSLWYDLMESRPNTKTRYYFNIAGLETKLDASAAIQNPEDLIYWNVFDYARYTLQSNVAAEFFHSSVHHITSAAADIDMSGYCFYPSKKEGVTVNFSDRVLTFGRPAHVSCTNQFLGLQAGLLSDITAYGSDSTANISHIKLGGTASYLGSGRGSGALICGTVFGAQEGLNKYYVFLSVKDVCMDGVAVETTEAYRPLMLNRLGSFVESTVSGITQDGYTAGQKAASSLMGRGGYLEGTAPSAYIKMTLSGIILDGKIGTTVFTKASLFYDVLYAAGSGTFIYNFDLNEDWAGTSHIQKVTYGGELTIHEDQHCYFDQELFVQPVNVPGEGLAQYDFPANYIPYVFIGYDAQNDAMNLNLSVNRKSADFIEGFGTYRYPYIIRTAKQLESISSWLSTNDPIFSEGWEINFPRGDWSSLSTLDLTDYYTVQKSGDNLSWVDDSGRTLEKAVLLDYLAGAYYKFADGTDLELSTTYSGIGSTVRPFHGVIHGNGCTVTMPLIDSDHAITQVGYGFINVANGCTVYDLSVNYTGIAMPDTAFTATDAATSGPNATALDTSLPHFGGIIAWVVGGDNLLDSVSVSATSVTAGAAHTVCGGYVGQVSGGGVLLNNLTAPGSAFADSSRLYHNAYVGRVISGYALAVDGASYENGKVLTGYDAVSRSDFPIPGVADKSVLTGHHTGYSGGTFTLDTAQDLLFLSFGMNSGAFGGNNGYAYGLSAKSRYGAYADVGNTHLTEEQWEAIVTAGKYADDTSNTGIFAAYFGIQTPTDLRKTNLTIRLTGSQYDLSGYGNAMRAMSGAYANSPTYQVTSFAADNKATISLNMDMLQYAVKNTDVYEPDSIQCYGLFGRLSVAGSFRNIVLTGRTALTLVSSADNTAIAADRFTGSSADACRAVGAFLGRSNGGVILQNVALENMTVASPDLAGGLVGYNAGGNMTVENENTWVNENVTVSGKRHTGGALGYTTSGKISITGFQIGQSIVETRVGKPEGAANAGKTGTGGVVGGVEGGSGIALENCTVTNTATVFFANYRSTSSSGGAGGLVGWSSNPVSAVNCTVNGGVVFGLSSLTNDGKYPYSLAPSQSTTIPSLPQDIRDSLVYNGENQNSVNILGYFLEQTTSSSNYSLCGAGGLLGCVRSSVELTGCTLTAESGPFVLASHNDSGGFIGELRETTSTTVTLTDCSITSGGHSMFIIASTRLGGVLGYHETKATSTFQLQNVRITGTAQYPVRLLQVCYSSLDAGGLFGDLSSGNLTVNDSEVSYCIIAGAKATAGVSTLNMGTVTLNNFHVENNLIYSNKSNRVGGIICDNTTTTPVVDMNGVYVGKNWMVSKGGAGGLGGTVTKGFTAKNIILDDNVLRRLTSNPKIANFTFAVNSLADGAAADALFDRSKSDLNYVGLIAASNVGSVTAISVSCYSTETTNTPMKNFGAVSGTGTNTVVYAGYGAQNVYSGYTPRAELTDPTPQELAISAMSDSFTVTDGEETFYGDSVTDNTPITIDALKWWPYADYSLDSSDMISELQQKKTGVTTNQTLQLLCLSDQTDATMKGYINLLTGGGFAEAVKNGLVSVESNRYSVTDSGVLQAMGETGSVVFDGANFSVGVYDNLETKPGTITVLSFTYKLSAAGTAVYTMHVPVYYQRSVDIKTFVVPVEGEQYYLPTFWNFVNEPSVSLATSASFGSPFTLYVEYDYSDMAMKLERPENFLKQIELTQPDGNSDQKAYIESGTEFILIDLNSRTPDGYTYYTLGLTENKRFIDFSEFTRAEEPFDLIHLADLEAAGGYLADNRVCKDQVGGLSECVYTERYLLVVFPVQNVTDRAMTYNMKAVIDENQRKATNIAVDYLKTVFGQISVWGSPAVITEGSYVDQNAESQQFSNMPEEPIRMLVDTQITFAKDYISSLNSLGRGVYGTHILRLRDTNEQYVELPLHTAIQVTTQDGTPVYSTVLDAPTSQIKFSIGDILKSGVSGDVVSKDYKITMDFSNVSEKDFYDAFGGSRVYTLVDSLYLSGNSDLLGSVSYDASKPFSVKLQEAIKLSAVPLDNRYLGINLSAPDDITNSGVIDFTVLARTDSFVGKEFDSMTLNFSVSRKVYRDGAYVYEPVADETPSLWQIKYGGAVLTKPESVTLPVVDNEGKGEFQLVVNRDYHAGDPDVLTNYRLIVSLEAVATDGTPASASDYFVFLMCDLVTEPAD